MAVQSRIVLEPSAQGIVDATSTPPFLYELEPAQARKVLDDLQAAPIEKLPIEEEWITVSAAVRFNPTPPAFRLSSRIGTSLSWKRLMSAPRERTDPRDLAPIFLPYLGDYNMLLSRGNEFLGIFSAGNTPDPANFPSGVVFQRRVSQATHQLLDASGSPVDVSIDPFFFSVPVMP